MSTPTDDSSPDGDQTPATRRHRRHHKRRRTRRGLFAAGAVVGALAVGGSALALTGVVEIGQDSDPAGAEHPTGNTIPAATFDTAAAEARPCRSPLNPLDPLRLWIGGDSLAGSLGPSLGELTAKTGVVQPVFLSKVSSGLGSPDFFDWPKRGGEELFKLNPEVAVFIIGANDFSVVEEDPAGWRPEYEQLVEQMMTLLIGEGRTVFWIGAPVFGDDRSEEILEVNQVFQEVAARHTEVVYVDAYAMFSTPDGEYTPFLPDGTGETIRVRADDGVHFTPEGGDFLARNVFAFLDSQCSMTNQAVPGAEKEVIETQGSSRVPGTSREGTTTMTTAPPATVATAPPETAPPTTAPPTSTTIATPPCTIPVTGTPC
jgi:hypothetical protein